MQERKKESLSNKGFLPFNEIVRKSIIMTVERRLVDLGISMITIKEFFKSKRHKQYKAQLPR